MNGAYLLNPSTVQKDANAIDSLYGDADRAWFLANDEDLHTDRADPTEILTVI